MWQQWTNAILGILVIALPFTYFSVGTQLTWTLAVVGVIIAALGMWGAIDRNSELTTREEIRRQTRTQ